MDDNVGMHHGASANNTNTATSLMADAPGCIPTSVDGNPTTIHNTLPVRKNLRAEFHDYSGGDYFVTICTRDKEHYFGYISNGEMKFSVIGKVAYEFMESLASHYSYVEVPLFVVMPNHVHAIICIRERADATKQPDASGCIPTIRTALDVVVGGYKQAVTRYARRNDIEFGWQSRYHDHIIRGTYDGNRIAEYIENNVARWDADCFNPSTKAAAPGCSPTQI